jgi:predicted 2-oxoglutarate/Fe(II)-dependent dioxygenase YbiX
VPKKQYTQVFARAKKAEADLKALREAQAQPQNINNDPQLSDELKLIARGLSDEEIDKAKVVAKGLGISLPEAIKDPLFLSYQNTLKEEKRKEKAKLGASKGSGESQESTLVRPGMSEEEHQEAFKKVLGL